MIKVTFSTKREDGFLVDNEMEFRSDREATDFARSLKCGTFNGRKVIGMPVIERT